MATRIKIQSLETGGLSTEAKAQFRDEIGAAAAGAAGGEAFPVGSVFISVVATDPATLLGYGTWSAIGAGRVLVGINAADADFDTVKETGGAKTVAAAGSNSAPTFTGSALGTHAHGAGTLVPSAHAGATVDDHASHTHTYSDIVNHTHPVVDPGHTHNFLPRSATTGAVSSIVTGTLDTSSTISGSNQPHIQSATTGVTTSNPVGAGASGTTNGPSATLSHTVGQANNHTMSGTSEAVSAGTPAGTVSAPTFTGSPTSVVQPYLVVHIWERTA